MKNSSIIKPNSKGQIVIPQAMRKAFGITTTTHLRLVQWDTGMFLYPVQEIMDALSHENQYPAILKKTKGTWQEGWEIVRARRKKIERTASKKRQAVW